MVNQVVYVHHKKYATGLFWQPIGAGFVARNYAKNLARSIDKKLNLFAEYRGMVGLGAHRAGHRVGMPSIAAEVMESMAEYTSFLGAFATDKKFVVIAVRNGVILEDKVFDSESDAREEYVKLSQIPDWGALIAPNAWGMPRAIEHSLYDVVENHSRVELHAISRFGSRMTAVMTVAAFLLVLLYFLRDPIGQMLSPRPQVADVNPELVAEYKRQIEEKNKELDVQFEIEKPLPPEPIVMPFENLPDPERRAEVCYQAIGFLMQPVPGWNQLVATCGETHVTAEFRRSFGTLGDFYNVASELMPGILVAEQSEDLLVAQATLPSVKTSASQDERDADTIIRDITSAFQGIDTRLETSVVVDTLTNGVDVATVNVVEIAVSSKLTPMQFMKIFQDFGGVYMTSCTWDVARRIWNYEVIIYAK